MAARSWGDHVIARLGAEISFAVFADANGVRFHVVATGVELGADLVGAQFGLDGAGVVEKRGLVANGEDANRLRGAPEQEVAGVKARSGGR